MKTVNMINMNDLQFMMTFADRQQLQLLRAG
jgi:hypothetical protein